MPTPIRNFRISDEVWQPAVAKADRLGVPLTAIIKGWLKSFASERNNSLYIDEGRIDLPRIVQKEVNIVARLASKQVKKRLGRK